VGILPASSTQKGRLALNPLQAIATLSILIALSGCTKHRVDSVLTFCELISGEDLQAKYGTPWTAVFSFEVVQPKIQDDYVAFLNDGAMKDARGRVKRMVWRESNVLHLINPASLWVTDPAEFVSKWKEGLSRYSEGKAIDQADLCAFGPAAELFDELNIHHLTSRNRIYLDSDEVTKIPTNRGSEFNWGSRS